MAHDGLRKTGAVCTVCQAGSAVNIWISDKLSRISCNFGTECQIGIGSILVSHISICIERVEYVVNDHDLALDHFTGRRKKIERCDAVIIPSCFAVQGNNTGCFASVGSKIVSLIINLQFLAGDSCTSFSYIIIAYPLVGEDNAVLICIIISAACRNDPLVFCFLVIGIQEVGFAFLCPDSGRTCLSGTVSLFVYIVSTYPAALCHLTV